MHENPISPLNHLPCNLGITGFIRVPEIPSPQIEKVKDETESYQEENLGIFLRIDFIKSFFHDLLRMYIFLF